MGSDEGGLEELVELSLSRASRSRTRCSRSRTRALTESKTARMAIWAAGGTVFQSGSGMGGRGIIVLILRAYYTKGSARERARREWGNGPGRPGPTAPDPRARAPRRATGGTRPRPADNLADRLAGKRTTVPGVLRTAEGSGM